MADRFFAGGFGRRFRRWLCCRLRSRFRSGFRGRLRRWFCCRLRCRLRCGLRRRLRGGFCCGFRSRLRCWFSGRFCRWLWGGRWSRRGCWRCRRRGSGRRSRRNGRAGRWFYGRRGRRRCGRTRRWRGCRLRFSARAVRGGRSRPAPAGGEQKDRHERQCQNEKTSHLHFSPILQKSLPRSGFTPPFPRPLPCSRARRRASA